MQHAIREELRGVLLFVGTIWVVFLADRVLPIDLAQWGIVPRSLFGLVGIPFSPFLHAGWGHILSNTVPLAVLLVLLAGSRARSWEIVTEIILLGGALLWLFGRPGPHVGASGLIYGLIAFLLVSGFREKRFVPLAVALLVGFLYGTTLIWGVLPSVQSHVSWEGHLTSAIAGGAIAYTATAKRGDAELQG